MEEYEIRVHVIEARELQPREKNGTSDPICYVEFGKESVHTQRFDQTLSCVWDRWYVFKKKMTPDTFATERVVFSVFDANSVFKDVMIGSFEVDLDFVYHQEGHEIFARWLVLSEPKRKHKGIQGYLKASVIVLGPNDRPLDHEIDAEFEEDQNGSSLQSMVLMPPNIPVEEYQLQVNVYRAEGLPQMDVNGKCDAFVKVIFGGAKQKTKVKNNTFKPEWNQQLLIPFTMPTMANVIRVEIKDHDTIGDNDIISVFSVKLDEIISNPKEPYWVNLYADHENKDAQDTAVGSSLSEICRGRLLIQFRAFPSTSPELGKTKVIPTMGPQTVSYTLRLDVYEIHEVPFTTKIRAKAKVGSSDSIKTKCFKVKNKISEFYQALPDTHYDLPEDESQLPDIFVSLLQDTIGNSQPYGYIRINVLEALQSHELPKWYEIEMDPVGKSQIPKGKFPGYALLHVSFDRTERLPKRQMMERIAYTDYQLRAHIYQANNLTPHDDDGSNDPFCVLQVGPHKAKTRVIDHSNYPQWFETLVLDLPLAADVTKAANIFIKIYDKDDWPSADDYIGQIAIRPEDIGRSFRNPKWKNVIGKKGKIEGELLVSFQLMRASDIHKYPLVDSLIPECRPCMAELSILNLTDISLYKGTKVTHPYIRTLIGDDKLTKSKTDPVRAKGGSAIFMQKVLMEVEVPIDPIYASAINVELSEKRGMSKDRIAGAVLPMSEYMPWIDYPQDEIQLIIEDLVAESSEENDVDYELDLIKLEDSDDETLILLDENELDDFSNLTALVDDINYGERTMELPPEQQLDMSDVEDSDSVKEQRLKLVQELEGTFTVPFSKKPFLKQKHSMFHKTTVTEAAQMAYTFNIIPIEDYKPTPDLTKLYGEQEVVVRVYVLRGKQMVPKDDDGLADPWLSIQCGDFELKDEDSLRPDTLNPLFYKTYVFTMNLPAKDSKLRISCWDRDGKNDNELIGITELELADRWYSKEWQKMPLKPIELRSLYHPKSRIPQGNLEMWVDIMTPNEARNSPVVNIEPPKPKQWQLRLIIWNVNNIPPEHHKMDFFVTGRLGDHKVQNTDIHYNSKDGTGAFNWRFIWNLVVPSKHNNRFTVAIWDKNFVSVDEALGEASLNLSSLFKKAEKAGDDIELIELEKQWVRLTLPYKDGFQGDVEISMQLMTESYALQHPIGKGRDGLPDVVRPPPPWDLAHKFGVFGKAAKKKIIIIIVVIVVLAILGVIIGIIV